MQRREYSLHVNKQEFFIYSFARLLGESTHSVEYVKSTLLSVQLKYLTYICPCQCHRDRDRIPILPHKVLSCYFLLLIFNISILHSKAVHIPCSNQQAGSRVLSFSLRMASLVRKGGIVVFTVCQQSQTLSFHEV